MERKGFNQVENHNITITASKGWYAIITGIYELGSITCQYRILKMNTNYNFPDNILN
jgi:hypothetical protein